MKRSKLETYYETRFGTPAFEDDAPDLDRAPPPVRRREPARRRVRRSFGLFRLVKLTLMLGPMAILLGTTLLMDCQGSARGAWVPQVLRSTACARRDLAERAFSLDGNLRTIAGSIR